MGEKMYIIFVVVVVVVMAFSLLSLFLLFNAPLLNKSTSTKLTSTEILNCIFKY